MPVPPIPDLAGKRGGNPRFPTRPESGNREFPIPDSAGNFVERESGSRLAANREIGDTPLCEYSMHDPGLDVFGALIHLRLSVARNLSECHAETISFSHCLTVVKDSLSVTSYTTMIHDDTVCATVVRGCDCAEALLTGRVPLQ